MKNIGNLQKRSQIIKTIRRFFDERGFLEVDPPVLQICPTFDPHIGAYKVQGADKYLRTSPEIDMKKLLSAGAGDIYTIGPNFRKDNRSPLHAPEFTMIEWYRVGVDYTAIMDDCVNLFRAVSDAYSYKGVTCNPHKSWQKLSVCEAFKEFADIDLTVCLHDRQLLEEKARAIGVRVIADDTWDDIFHAIISEKIESHLGYDVPCILYDYPASQAALSRKKPSDERFAERFEIYICGIELANAFSELTDAAEQRTRFNADMGLKEKLYGERYPADEDFFTALENGLPDCAGIALGIDRLVMLALGENAINSVMLP